MISNNLQQEKPQLLRRVYNDGIVIYRRKSMTIFYHILNDFILHLLNCVSNFECKI